MPVKILSVDDSRTIRLIVANAFRGYDCQVGEAANGEEGLAAVTREKPDLVILDVAMPVMDGVTMLTRMKEDPGLSTIPVIMLTSESGGEDDRLYFEELGAHDYLTKPVEEKTLVERAGRVVPLQKRAKGVSP